MGAKELLFRVISSEANIDGMKWRSMLFSEKDYNQGMQAIGDISKWGLEIHEEITTIEEIKRTLTQAVKEDPEGDHLAIIDYLQLIKTAKKYDRRDLEVGDIARELKLLAKKLNIPIILLSQLSRGVEQRQDKRPVNSDLRDSGNIEEHADLVGFLYRDDYYDSQSEKQNIIEIILSKQRNGPIGTVELAFIKEYGKFVNLDYQYSAEEVPTG